jgi:uroporphyrinogen decarboxylase
MKPRDIFKAQIEHSETDTVPYTVDFDGEIDLQLDDYYGSKAWRDSVQTFHKVANVVNNRKRSPIGTPGLQKDVWGTIWRHDRRPEHLEQPGMLEPSLAGYRWPAPEEFFASAEEIEAAQQLCKRECGEYFIISNLGWGLFESSWGLRGFENAMMDMAAEPQFFEELLERLTEQFLAYVNFTCDQLPEIDAIMFGDDWAHQRGIMGGPERWRKLFKPMVRQIYDLAHKRGKLVITHCCGSVVDIMADVIEIGLDVFESMQPEARGMNPYELKAEFGKDIAFWGCLGSQSTIPFGTPDEIRAEVAKLKQEMGKGGGYILAPAKTLQPGTPVENAAAVVESFTA